MLEEYQYDIAAQGALGRIAAVPYAGSSQAFQGSRSPRLENRPGEIASDSNARTAALQRPGFYGIPLNRRGRRFAETHLL